MDGRGNPDGFFADFHRPGYPNTPVANKKDCIRKALGMRT